MMVIVVASLLAGIGRVRAKELSSARPSQWMPGDSEIVAAA